MKNTIMVEGVECELERVEFYLKKGAYSHAYVKGWQAVDMNGEIVISGDPGAARSAEEYQQPKFKTKKELVYSIEFDNQEWGERKRRRAEK